MAQASGSTDVRGATHRWKFFRAGGFDQALLDTGADLAALDTLDQKLWVALSCPAAGIELDRKTLELVDSDADGHIRAPELLAAVKWAGSVLTELDFLVRRQGRLPLSAINGATEEGRAVLGGAKLVLSILGKGDAAEISLDDVCDTERIFSQARFNGDGVVPADAADEPALRSVVEDAIACLGGQADRSGKPGVTAETIEAFYKEAGAIAAWWDAAGNPGTLPFGVETAARYEIYHALEEKIEDYFQRCRLAAYDLRCAALIGPSDADYQKLATLRLGKDPEPVFSFPLAVPAAGKPMPLSLALNPAFAAAVQGFRKEVVAPALGEIAALTEEGWATLRAHFAPYEAWMASKPATAVEKLGEERVRQILAGDGKAALVELVERDKAVEPEVTAIASVERLLRYCRDLHVLINNFVSFRDFYTRRGKGSFQAGTLFLDGRSVELCVAVEDVNRHAAIAALSHVCLVYCECTRKGGEEKATIAAGFTAGDSDFLTVGRNGVFYDRKGRDWDATIVRIVDHPISVRQAFWAPYKRLARAIGEQMQKLAAARSKAAEQQRTARMIVAAEHAAAGKAAPPPPPSFDVAKFAGIFAAIGLAIGAIGAALVSVVSGIVRLAWWQIPLLVLGIVLLVSAPSVFLAWLKLRRRNLGPILDANGWAVNARAKINLPFGASLTAAAKLPEGAERSLADPFSEKRRSWILYLLLALAAVLFLWRQGYLGRWLGG